MLVVMYVCKTSMTIQKHMFLPWVSPQTHLSSQFSGLVQPKRPPIASARFLAASLSPSPSRESGSMAASMRQARISSFRLEELHRVTRKQRALYVQSTFFRHLNEARGYQVAPSNYFLLKAIELTKLIGCPDYSQGVMSTRMCDKT